MSAICVPSEYPINACAQVIPHAGVVNKDAASGIAAAALLAAARIQEPADLIILAVPAGMGARVADRITRGPLADGTTTSRA